MRSTLPDLFNSDLNAIKFHPQNRPIKIGGRFAINLNTHQTHPSPEKSHPHLHKLHSSAAFTRSIYQTASSHPRSQSINQLAPALKQGSSYGNNSLNKARKSVNFVNEPSYISTRNQSVSALSRETPTLQQIYIQNTIKNNAMSQRTPGLGFPYETTRSMNNMKIEMEEADSFKNRVQTLLQSHAQHEKSFAQIMKQSSYIKSCMAHFRQGFIEDLLQFESEFKFMCKDLMKGLSMMRRQTSEQTKINQADAERAYYEYRDAGEIMNLLENRTNLLREECIENDKIELTNSKTYSQDVQLRIHQSQKGNELERLFRRSKRSGTSHDFRAGTSQSVRTGTSRVPSRGVMGIENRAQTTEVNRRRSINMLAHQTQNEDSDELIYEEMQEIPNQYIKNEQDEFSQSEQKGFQRRPLVSYEQQVIEDY